MARELEEPAVWSNPARAQELGRERARLSAEVAEIDRATKGIGDATELLELAGHFLEPLLLAVVLKETPEAH